MTSIKDIGELIPVMEATALAAEYRALNPGAPLGHLFGEKVIREVLDQHGAEGIRIYYGVKPGATPGTVAPQLILVGVDKHGNDIVPGVYGDRSQICPPMCSAPNAINGL
jgi:hypothetical protein